jgi:hypothetical protein
MKDSTRCCSDIDGLSPVKQVLDIVAVAMQMQIRVITLVMDHSP